MNKLVLSNEAISIAVRDFFKIIIILGIKLVKQKLFIKFVKCIIRPFRTGCMKYFTKSFLYYQQGSKSLTYQGQQKYPNSSDYYVLLYYMVQTLECTFIQGSDKVVMVICTTIHRYPIFSTRYSVMCKVYTGYCGTSEIEHGLCACTVDNLLAKARGLSLRTGAQTMLYLSLVN